MIMKQTVEEAAKECRRTTAQSMGVYAQYHSIDECPNHGITYDEIAEAAFIKGAEWQAKQSPWISVEDAIPNELAKGMCQVKYVDGSIDEMAKAAMQGFCSNPHEQIMSADSNIVAEWSIGFADSLIEKLKGE